MEGVRFKIKVRESGHSYIPEEVRHAGFVGVIDGLPNHFTFILVRPGATDEEVVTSLKEHIRHIQANLTRKTPS